MKAVLHDGTELNFPDGTDPSVVQATVKRVLSSRPGASTSPVDTPNAAAPGGSPAQGQTSAPEGFLNADGTSDMGDRIYRGLANVGIKGYLGAKQMFGKLTPEEEAVGKMSDSDVEHSGFAGKAANLAGNLGLGVTSAALVPEASVAKIPSFLRAVLGSGAAAAVETPVEDQDNIVMGKLKEAGKAAAAGGAINLGGTVLKKVTSGMFKPNADAATLFDQGVNPTLQQGADHPVTKFIGGLTSGLSNVRNRQEGEVLSSMADRISQGKLSTGGDMTAGEAVGSLSGSIDKDYSALLDNKKFPMTGTIRDNILRQGEIGKSGGRFSNQQADAMDALNNIVGSDRNPVRMNNGTLRDNYLAPLQQAIDDAKDPRVAEALVNAKNTVIQQSRNSQLKPDELSSLGDVDSRYFDMLRLKEASKGAASNETGVDISKLANSYGKAPGADVTGATNATNEALIGPLVRTLGATPRQDEARTFMNTMKRIAGLSVAGGATATVPALAAITAPMYGISALGQTAKGSKYLFGQYDSQKALKAALESAQGSDGSVLKNTLRALRDNSSALGASVTAGQ